MKVRTFRRCLNCKRVLMQKDQGTGLLVPGISRFPYCGPCFGRHLFDPEFKSFIIKHLHAKNHRGN